MSDTPRTDARAREIDSDLVRGDLEFCRELERENAALKALLLEALSVIEQFNSDCYEDHPRVSERIRIMLGMQPMQETE